MARGGPVAGMVQAGNIDISDRPSVKVEGGKTASVLSGSYPYGKREVLIPHVRKGLNRPMTNKEAQKHYEKTGEHLGIFSNSDSATEYAEKLHQDQEGREVLMKMNPSPPHGKNGVFSARGKVGIG